MSYSFDPGHGLIVLPVRCHGKTGDVIARLALDTGATSTLLNWELAALLGYDPASAKDRVHITTGSGVNSRLESP